MSRILAVLAFAFALNVFAADVTGTWSGTADIKRSDGETENGGAYMVLKQTGQDVTGTAGPSADEQVPIEKGRFEGKKLTFVVNVQGDNPRSFRLELQLIAEDKLDGTIEGDAGEGRKLTGKLSLTRQK